jgi:prevent-host-death family protein
MVARPRALAFYGSHPYIVSVTTLESFMEIAGIKTLKAQLSAYVAKAHRGERVIITDRGQEMAALGPLSPARQVVHALAQRGKLRWSGDKPTGLTGMQVRGGAVSETVIEDRLGTEGRNPLEKVM